MITGSTQSIGHMSVLKYKYIGAAKTVANMELSVCSKAQHRGLTKLHSLCKREWGQGRLTLLVASNKTLSMHLLFLGVAWSRGQEGDKLFKG